MNRSAQHAFEPEEIMAYLDGELEPRRASSLAVHLDHCAECQAHAVQFRQISERMLSFQVEASPASVNKWVLAGLSETQDPGIKPRNARESNIARAWRSFARNPFSWAFACILILAVLLAMGGLSLLRLPSAAHVASQRLEFEELASRSVAVPAGKAGGGERTRADFNSRKQSSAERKPQNSALLQPAVEAPDVSGPMIARKAELSIVVKDFAPVEAAVKGITGHHHGYIGELNTVTPQNAARRLTATLRIPSPQLDAALAELKQLGRVEQESQSGEEVTKEYTDLAARLKNSRATEQRLVDVLRNNTGKVKDVLDVEKEIARVRGEIELMEADQRALKTRVDFAMLQLTVGEEFRASLQVAPPSSATRLHNALVEGYHDVVESLIGFAVWLLEAGPTLLIWGALLFFPALWAWKRWRRRAASAKPSSAEAA